MLIPQGTPPVGEMEIFRTRAQVCPRSRTNNDASHRHIHVFHHGGSRYFVKLMGGAAQPDFIEIFAAREREEAATQWWDPATLEQIVAVIDAVAGEKGGMQVPQHNETTLHLPEDVGQQ